MEMPRRTRYVREEEVKGLFSFREAVEVVEAAFREKGEGKAVMPPKSIIPLPEGDIRAMPAYLQGMNIAGVKVVNSHPLNRKRGLPTVMAVLVMIEPETGFPLAVIEASYLTAVRTGAAGALALKLLARKDSSTAAIIGAGVQGRFQLIALNHVFPHLSEIRIWSMEPNLAYRLKSEFEGQIKPRIEVAPEPEGAVRGADIIITATPSRRPIIMDGWVKEGAHINAIGADAPGKQELDPAILKRARIFLDDWRQGMEAGEVNVPISSGELSKEDIAGEISDVLVGRLEGRRSDDEITVFCSTGLAIQDVAVGSLVISKLSSRMGI